MCMWMACKRGVRRHGTPLWRSTPPSRRDRHRLRCWGAAPAPATAFDARHRGRSLARCRAEPAPTCSRAVEESGPLAEGASDGGRPPPRALARPTEVLLAASPHVSRLHPALHSQRPGDGRRRRKAPAALGAGAWPRRRCAAFGAAWGSGVAPQAVRGERRRGMPACQHTSTKRQTPCTPSPRHRERTARPPARTPTPTPTRTPTRARARSEARGERLVDAHGRGAEPVAALPVVGVAGGHALRVAHRPRRRAQRRVGVAYGVPSSS